MRKFALYACVAVTSLVLSVNTPAIAAPLSQQVGLTSSPRTLVDFIRRGADDNLKHRRRGGGNDDGPGHVSHQSSTSRHGADDSAGHEHHGGGDDSGHGGNHGGGDDHGGRR